MALYIHYVESDDFTQYKCISKNTCFFITEPKRYHVAKSVFDKMLMIFSFTYLVFYEKNCQKPLSKVIAIFPILKVRVSTRICEKA